MEPDAIEAVGMVGKDGLFLSHKDGNQECCQVRRVMPLWNALKGLLPWMTELKHQSRCIGVRTPVIGTGGLLKWNSVAKVNNHECGSFLLAMILLFNSIHFCGHSQLVMNRLPEQRCHGRVREGICLCEDVRQRVVVCRAMETSIHGLWQCPPFSMAMIEAVLYNLRVQNWDF